MLSARGHFGLRNLSYMQYWKSAEHLQAYAHSAGRTHLPAWKAFNQRVGTGGDVGIWHETYVVPRGFSESVYVNMPRYGLGMLGTLLLAIGPRANAAKQLVRTRDGGA